MKKIISVLLVSFTVMVLISGCSAKAEATKVEKPKEVKIGVIAESFTDSNEGYSIINKGDYYLFSSKNSDTYIMFLDWLDKNTYEVVDIQLEHFSDGNFFVTYKKK